jgi:hypothetical protein
MDYLRTISYDEIDLQWISLTEMSLDDIPAVVNELGQVQPYILTYLMATGSDILDDEEREILLFMGLMVWKLVISQVNSIPEISGEELSECEEKNLNMLEYLAGEPEEEFFITVEKIMNKYHQSEMLRYCIDRIMEEPESENIKENDNIGMIVIYLKSVIDCLDSAV